MEQQHTRRVDIGLDTGSRTLKEFGRHVERRPLRAAVQRISLELSCTEIHEDDAAAVVRAHHVLRLHIAMNDAGAMHCGQRPAHLLSDAARFTGTQPSFGHTRGQGFAVDEIHPEADATVMTVCPVNSDDVVVAYARQPARLVQKVGWLHAAFRFGFEQLQRNGMIEPRVVRVKDFTVRALSNLAHQEQMAPHAVVRCRW